MQNTNAKTIFFDVGGILLTNGWGHLSRQKAAEKFHLDFTEVEALHNFIFNIYEMGVITLDEYLDTVIFNQPRDFPREDFKEFMFAQSQELPEMLQWLKEWKKNSGFRIISINNEGRELNMYRIKKFKLHHCFDAFVSSCEVKMRKPDPGIFQLAMGIAQVSPDECIYFDDRIMLVQAASKLGIRSLHHTSPATTIQVLEQLKLEIVNRK